MTLDPTQFETLSDETLERIMDVIEDELGDYGEADIEAGILTIDMDSGAKYIINKHGPLKQIWMASPVSGASHYDYDEKQEAWIDTRGDEDLLKKLSAELAAATGENVSI